MPPSIVWGVGVGLAIAAIDALAVVLMTVPSLSQWPIADLDYMANIVLYSFIGFRVGKVTGVVREAAESGVLAAAIVAVVGIAVSIAIRPSTEAVDTTMEVVRVVSHNVALGGVLAIVAGWVGSRSNLDRPVSRR